METKGLTTHEAKLLSKQFGANIITEKHHPFRGLAILLGQIFSMLNLLLIAAAAIAIFIQDYTDAIMIFAIVILNSLLSFWQEYRAEATLTELRKLSPQFVRVIRDNKEISLNSHYVVPGDIILLEMGDRIPADGLVIEAINLETNESSLTGESNPVYKKVDEAEHNQVFAGTLIASGRGKIKVTQTGDATKFGQIAKTLSGLQDTETPLQKQIKKLAVNLAVIAVVLSFGIYGLGIFLGYGQIDMFLTAVSTAVAIIPEGLPSIILITMAVGVKRMAQKRAVVRKLLSIEGLGSVNVICTDKTGTLTLNQMRVQKVWFNYKTHAALETKPLFKKYNGKRLLDAMLVVNTAALAYKVDKRSADVLGDGTEGSLLLLAHSLGIDYETHRASGEILDEFSFDQNIKSMSAVWKKQEKTFGLVKGSPEFLIANSIDIATDDGVRKLNDGEKQKLTESYQAFARQGYRVIAFGYKETLPRARSYDRKEVESNLVFLGLAALIDPLRPEVKQAIKTASMAGIRSVMITGDNELTAMTIARDLGLSGENDDAVLGKDIEKLSDEELAQVIEKVRVFARTKPEDKLRIVKAFQNAGFSVAVTGDGVNDALALKQAEIGVAMGKKGTDVAKEAADIVITDDNYATIITAIEEGRAVYDNILKSVRYLLSTNIGEGLVIIIALASGLPAPLLPAQILWINLVSDGLPALALAVDPKDPNSMRKNPRHKEEKLLNLRVTGFLFVTGLIVALSCLVVFWIVLKSSNDVVLARTAAFTSLVVLQLIVAFLIQAPTKKINYNLIGAIVLTLLIQYFILDTPRFHPVFGIKTLW